MKSASNACYISKRSIEVFRSEQLKRQPQQQKINSDPLKNIQEELKLEKYEEKKVNNIGRTKGKPVVNNKKDTRVI